MKLRRFKPDTHLQCSTLYKWEEERERPCSRLTVHHRVRAADTLMFSACDSLSHPYMYVSCKPCMSEHRSPCGMMCNIWICTCLITHFGPNWVQLPWQRQLYSTFWDASFATTLLAQQDHPNARALGAYWERMAIEWIHMNILLFSRCLCEM